MPRDGSIKPIKEDDKRQTEKSQEEKSAPQGALFLILQLPRRSFACASAAANKSTRCFCTDARRKIGRYLQADPLEFVNGPSLFAYAMSSPAVHTDPDGQFAPLVARIVVGGAAGYIVDAGLQYAFKGCVDWNAAFWRGGLIGAGLGAPHWWWSSRSAGGGVRLWRHGPGIDWHRFTLNGRRVNRPHLEPGGKASQGHHWPWN